MKPVVESPKRIVLDMRDDRRLSHRLYHLALKVAEQEVESKVLRLVRLRGLSRVPEFTVEVQFADEN